MKRAIANLVLLVMSAALMAGAFEIACRTIVDTGMNYELEMWKYALRLKRIANDPALGHEHVPNTHAHLMGADVVINSRGLRDREVAMPKPAGAKRILMLGDSITFGWGVERNEAMPAVLERDLIQGSFGSVEVINSGVGNYNTAMEVAYFLANGVAYEPDIVVLNYFINDAEPTPIYRVPWLARHSYGYVIAGSAWDTLSRRLLGAPDWRGSYLALYADQAPGWLAAQKRFRALAAYCHEHKIRIVVANIPELHEVGNYPFASVNDEVKALAEETAVEYVDLLSSVRGEEAATLWVTKPDPHPNAKAHALMARALADYLLASNVRASN